jgi:AcrR family transcriptional regulator
MSESVAPPPPTARRAPFSDNPNVGQRGQRTQQRILDSALAVFGEEGFHRASVGRITARTGCSRATFYQYFSDKEDVFTHLVGQVIRQVGAAVEALDPITPDQAGLAVLRGWIRRFADIFERYGPVFHAFSSAEERSRSVGQLRSQAASVNISRIHAKVQGTALGDRELDAVLDLLLDTAARVFYNAEMLRRAEPDACTPERVETALADVVHRCLFGRIADVNVHTPAHPPMPEIAFDSSHAATVEGETPADLSRAARTTLDSLLRAGIDVILEQGYHDTRVDDLVAAAGLSHGAFYRYFTNKAHFTRMLVIEAMEPLSHTLAAVPADATRAQLRTWLKHYNEVQASEAAIIRIWVDATLHDPELRVDAAAALDWGRRRLARFLAERPFGDHDADAIVLLGVLDAFGGRRLDPSILDTTTSVIERGLLGR